MIACLAAATILLAAILGIHAHQVASPVAADSRVDSVHITRNPGLFVAPPIDRVITDRRTAEILAGDIEALPPFPSGTMFCPIDYGTTYNLAFSSGWSAVVSVRGCQQVAISDGRELWAWGRQKLFSDLGNALGLAPDELVLQPCAPAAAGERCYPQP